MLGKGNIKRVEQINSDRLQRSIVTAPQFSVSKRVKDKRKRRDKARTQQRSHDRDRKMEKFDLHSGFIAKNIFEISSSRIEDLLLLVTGICNTTSTTSAVVHVLTYIKTHYKHSSMTEYVIQFVRIFFDEYFARLPMSPHIIDEFFNCDASQSSMELHAGTERDFFSGLMDALKNAQENWVMFKEGPYFKHLMCLISFVSTIGFFPSKLDIGDLSLDLFKIFHLRALDLQSEALNIFEALFSTIFFFVSRGYSIFRGNDQNLLDSEIDKMDAEYAIIVGAENLISSGKVYLLDEGHEPRIKSRYEYDMRLQQLITKMSYYKKLENNNFARKVYDDKIVRLHKIKFELLRSQNENHFRECPYSFMISGSSSIGKSTLNSILITAIAEVNGIEAGEGYKVVVNEQDKYDSDIKPHTTIITLDDFGNMRPDKVEDPPTRRIIDLINNMTKTAVKADVNEKGSVTINPKIVTITTNTSDLHANFFSVEPVAIMRRINVVIVPKLRPTHTDEYGGLRSDAFVANKDAWLFNVYKVKIELALQGNPMHRNPDKYKYVTLAENVSIYDLLDLIKKDSLQHFTVQRDIVSSYRENINKVCSSCGYPKLVCNCTKQEKHCEELLSKMEKHSGFYGPFTSLMFTVRIITIRAFFAVMLFMANFRYRKSIIFQREDSFLILLQKANRDARTLAYYYDRYSKLTFKSVYEKIWENAAVLVLGATAVSAYLIYRKCKVPIQACTQQGAVESTLQVPNCWKKPEFVEVPRSIHSVGVTNEQLRNIVSKAIAVLRIYDPVRKGSIVCNIVPLRGNYWLAPSHMFAEDRQHEISISYANANSLKPVYTGAVSPACWRRILNTDYIILQIIFAGDQPDLLKFFPSKSYLRENMALDFLYRDFRESDQHVHVEEAFVDTGLANMEIKGNNYYGCTYRTSIETFNGLCMATFITKAHSPVIVGFHLAGHGNRGVIVPISSDIVLDILQQMSVIGFDVHSSGQMDLNLYNINYKFTKTVHFRSPVNYLSNENGIAPSIKIYGSHELGRTNYNSAVVRTFISDDLEKLMGVKCNHGPPPLKNLKHYWHQDLDRISHDTVYIDHAVFQLALLDFKDYLQKQYDLEQISQLCPLSLDENVAGIDGRYGIDSLVLTTSMGFPLNCPKKKYLVPSERQVPGISRPLDVPLFLKRHMEDCENMYARGYRCYPILKTTMKDEPTVIGKQKRRLFQASPCWFIILIRKYFLPVGAYIQLNRLKFCTAVGANAHGKDWDDIAQHLMKFGSNRYIAGDYKAFDKKMPAVLLRAAGQVFVDIAKMSGNYSERDLFIMQGLLTDLIYPVLEYDGIFISVTSSHCSGNSLTVLLNNFANMLYMRMAYYTIYRDKGILPQAHQFHERVNLLVYGDDNVAEVHQDEEHFNHTSCANAMARFGIEYTMADKQQESIPFISIHEISFLKRRFRFETDLCRFVAPLELDSIFKSLHCMMRQRNMEECERSIVAGNIRSAFLEFWLHGREYYDDMAPKLWSIVTRHQLETLVGPYVSYDEHLVNYTNKYGSDLLVSIDSDEESQCDDFLFDLQSGFCNMARSHSCEGLLTAFIERTSDNVVFMTTIAFIIERIIIYYPNSNRCLCSTKSILHSETTTIVWSGKVNPQDFQLQSGREMFTIVNNSIKRQNVSYNASAPGYVATVSDSRFDGTFDTVSEQDNSLHDFLSRPVILASYSVGANNSLEGFTDSFNPWTTFLTNVNVKKKLANFKLLRANMRIRIELNGTPFQFGKIMVVYDVFEEAYAGNIQRADIDGNFSKVIPSQRMKVFLNPATSQGAEMLLPFFYKSEYLDLLDVPVAFNMGFLRFWSLAPFGNMNGSIDPMSIKVYGSLENVTLAMPTFFSQAGYETGIISKPATAIAAAAKVLADIPWLSPYMKATEYAASATAKIAALFGYSKPTSVTDIVPMVRLNVGNMATCNGTDTVQKLGVDGKNELTIDPRVVGLSGKDEMALANIAGIESYLFNFPWNTQTEGTLLASIKVTPIHYANKFVEGGWKYWWTASCTVGNAFNYWKGSQKFRFIVNSSTFHRGRLKIVWEPTVANVTSNPFLNTNYTHIVDLADTDDFTICVGWGASSMYLLCRQPDFEPVYDLSGLLGTHPLNDNGKLYVYVMNPLMSSSEDPPNIQVSVFTSMCDDVEFAEPTLNKMNQFTPFSLQSGFELHSGADNDPTSNDKPAQQPFHDSELVQMSDDCFVDNSNLVYFGEKVLSLRTLIKRYCRVTTEAINANNGSTPSYFRVIRWMFLGIPGPDTNAMHLSTTGRYNYTNYSYVTFFKLCFAGWRGSVRLKIAYGAGVGTGNAINVFQIARTGSRVTNETLTPVQYSGNAFGARQIMTNSSRGVAIADNRTRPYFDVEFPYYYNNRMRTGGRTSQVGDDSENFSVSGRVGANNLDGQSNQIFDIYHAGGEDFSFHYWMGPPVMYEITSLPTPSSSNPYPI